MNGTGWRSKLIEALVVLIAVAVVTRMVSQIIAPLLPGLVSILVICGLLLTVVRRR